jgi:hypothetical protein
VVYIPVNIRQGVMNLPVMLKLPGVEFRVFSNWCKFTFKLKALPDCGNLVVENTRADTCKQCAPKRGIADRRTFDRRIENITDDPAPKLTLSAAAYEY